MSHVIVYAFANTDFHSFTMTTTRSQAKKLDAELARETSTQDLVDVNWIFFDKSEPDTTSFLTSVPRVLYEGPSQKCCPLFIKKLRNAYGDDLKDENIMFWKVSGSLMFIVYSVSHRWRGYSAEETTLD